MPGGSLPAKKFINNLHMLVSHIRWTPPRQFFYIKNLSMFLYHALWTLIFFIKNLFVFVYRTRWTLALNFLLLIMSPCSFYYTRWMPCNQKRRVLNLNNHPITCWIYAGFTVSEVLKLTTTPDLLFLVTRTPAYTHETSTYTQFVLMDFHCFDHRT